jgi:type VI secretion system protein ImpF
MTMRPLPERPVPELTPQERLQPALLDRLVDEEPDRKVEPRERRVMSKGRLREAVLRDLAWLFNCTRLEASQPMAHVPYARRSVANFGLPALSGKPSSSLDVADLERAIRQAILDFEPRILAGTLEVQAIKRSSQEHHNIVGVQIHGQLWAQPVPLELLVRTDIDLETGAVEIADLMRSRVV